MTRRAAEWATARRHRATRRLTAVSAVAGLMAASSIVALAGPWDSGQRTAERTVAAQAAHPADGADSADGADAAGGGDGKSTAEDVAGLALAPTAEQVLTPLDAAGGRPPATGEGAAVSPRLGADLAAALNGLLADPALGERPSAVVLDAVTGEEVFSLDGGRAAAPASTVKIVTAVAALRVLGPDHRLATRTVYDPENRRVVLVGGGDTTLTAAQLARLAKRTAATLAERGVEVVRVGYDPDRFSTPEDRHPIGINENLAPLTSLMTDAGRLDGSAYGPAPRAADPAADAAEIFVRGLTGAGIEVKGAAARRTAPPGAERLAVHWSQPVSGLVERALTDSDNDLAESLARQVAVATGHTPDLAGSAGALTERLAALDVPLRGVRLTDGSGLDRESRLTAAALAAVLAAAAEPDRPELRPVLTGLPVAGFTGTLRARYADGGGGLVRAKTGTLTGVNALAGTAVHPDGRVLAFALLATGTTSPADAEAALDHVAAALTDG
jgi:D-alanyl-D-alanine carboxypeptidase/D-alanyl-D-alanine-endopeptidase (penicillin-binding protein 4)